MKLIKKISFVILIAGISLTGCKQSLVISDVDYAQPIETVLTPNEEGVVEDTKNGFSFNILPLQYAETEDTTSVTTEEVRYIRSNSGFYYITAPDYKHVYVMSPGKDQLKLENKIRISEGGLGEPALNQRQSHIQLVDLETGAAWALNSEGIQNEDSLASNKRGEE